MNKCYIISRFSAPTEEERNFNVSVARYHCRETLLNGKIPIAPHIYYTQFLDDSKEYERRFGLCLGKSALMDCDEYLAVIVDGIISEGMLAEIDLAKNCGIPGNAIFISKEEIAKRMAT